MKILLIAIALLVAVEAQTAQWNPYGVLPNIQHGRGNNPSRGPSWLHPQQHNQNTMYSTDIEWVCQNPKTNDMMFIAVDNTQHHPGRGGNRPVPQWQNNVPPRHQGHQHYGHYWPQPIIIVEERPDNNQISPSTTTTTTSPPLNNDNNNNDNQPQTTPHYHGGEGLIDVRIGA